MNPGGQRLVRIGPPLITAEIRAAIRILALEDNASQEGMVRKLLATHPRVVELLTKDGERS